MRVTNYVVVLALVASIAAPRPAAAQHGFEPLVLAPTSDWVLNYSAEYCGAVRQFGEGNSEIMLQLANFGTSEDYTFFFVGNPIPYTGGPSREIGVRMGSTPEFSDQSAIMGETSGKRSASFNYPILPPDRLEREIELRRQQRSLPWPRDETFEQSIHFIDLDFGDSEMTLQTGSLAPVLEGMRECRNNLLASWGMDPAIQNNLSRRPTFRQRTIRQTERGYPRSMSRVAQSAMVQFRVLLDAAGDTQSCVIQAPSPDPVFDQAVCDGMEGGFEPALDASGQPVEAVFAGRVYFSVSR